MQIQDNFNGSCGSQLMTCEFVSETLDTPCVVWSPAPALAPDCRGLRPRQAELGQPSSALNNIHLD